MLVTDDRKELLNPVSGPADLLSATQCCGVGCYLSLACGSLPWRMSAPVWVIADSQGRITLIPLCGWPPARNGRVMRPAA